MIRAEGVGREAWQGVRRLGGQGLGLWTPTSNHPTMAEDSQLLPLSGWAPPWGSSWAPGQRAHCVCRGSSGWPWWLVWIPGHLQCLAGQRPEWLPGRVGVHRAGPGSGGLMWLTRLLRGKCWVASSPPPAKGLHLLNGPCGYAARLGPGSRGCRGCLPGQRKVTTCQPLTALWTPEIGTQAEMEFLELAPR